MEKPVLKLYPAPVEERPLQGLYLSHNLRQLGKEQGRAYVYSNFITSLDGRIAISHPTRPGLMVPKQTANERDWRLFQELAAQADIIISSGRYLRDWADGRAQEILQVDDPRFADLRSWREENGLPPQPDIAIISGSLRFPIPDVLTSGGRKAVVFTIASADKDRIKEIEAKAGKVMIAGEDSVRGDTLVRQMGELGYRTVYSSAGPKIHHLLLAGGVLDRLYLSSANRLLGDREIATIVDGEKFDPPVGMTLNRLYHDAHGVDGLGQLFAVYDTVYPE